MTGIKLQSIKILLHSTFLNFFFVAYDDRDGSIGKGLFIERREDEVYKIYKQFQVNFNLALEINEKAFDAGMMKA